MNKPSQSAFTLVEILVVMAVILILTNFTYIDFFKSRSQVSLDTTITLLITDIRNQQLKIMSGNIQSGSINTPYGIYFDQNKYTLYNSANYSVNDPTNFVVNLDNSDQFVTINLPNNRIIFASSSGEITNFNPGQNTLTVKNQFSNKQEIISINRYGVVISAN
jgi:prepilin-type N-terminal cleavage/methylation domain-containing protein